MGSDWHPRRHPHPHQHPDANNYAHRSLPSFAELTSSSTDSLLHRPRDAVPPPPPPSLPPPQQHHHHHHHHHHHQQPQPPLSHPLPPTPIDRPVSRSTPPDGLSSTDFANQPLVVDRAAFTPINHASPHVSPTNTRAPPAAPQHQRYSQSLPHTTAAPYSPPLSARPPQPLHDTAPSQPPTVNTRQDSAVAQHSYDHPKDTEHSVPSSVFSFSYVHPAIDSRRQSASRPVSHPIGPSAPHSPPGESRLNQSQPPPETGAAGLRTVHPPPQPALTQFALEPTRSPQQERGPAAAPNSDSGFRNPLPSPTLDQTNGSGRHQRYNVRFNTVYTSENMPPSQKPRNDPPPTAPPTAEPAEDHKSPSEQTVTPSVEPVTPSAIPPPQSPEEQPPPQQQNAPQLERCKGCQEPWRRPLPGEDQYRLSSPAQNMNDQLALTQDFIKRLENHAKFADEAYATWQRKHRWCVVQPTSPPATDAPAETRSKSEEGHSPTEAPASLVSTKRKSEIPHEASKYRKVNNFESQSNVTPPVRPTAPA
ncbi:hypothetical protein COCSADRAFT_173426 [Bipolaris sorokiniana ND90Pr]|uniref:Uncharacterized protein n=1 Tax=Cochliobolus sativus (strain ND90Pr / ATCC 201652) TaxID=665912 RepID=M2SZ19_COCSN|nr:uncharacterized protein COCSADRAFT_173426 [Bipolaris sorokiniana ND90Pr]EMD62032.1 hypothetical protein COCSADRAFT_173426 [Bipolaris sorokiniana ND90Pr]